MAAGDTRRRPGGGLRATYLLAEVPVEISSLHADVHELCRDYLCDLPPELVVQTTQADIDFERERSRRTRVLEGKAPLPATDGYLETLAAYRQVAEALPRREAILVHGSCVAVDGAAYLFCAPSGTGKSTHARLWRELLGERAVMLNDDKPLLRVAADGVRAFGTPWDGKHRLSRNTSAPLRAVCLLGRSEANHIERVAPVQARPMLLRHVYRPQDPAALAATLGLLDRLTEGVGLWRLGCNTDIEAAELAYAAMKGEGA